MSRFFVVSAILCLTSGCLESPALPKPAKTAQSAPAEVYDTGPAAVELQAPIAKWRDKEIVEFEIPYKFTSGGPIRVYQCRVSFPTAKTGGVKPMQGWELKKEGIIKTGIPAGGKVVTDYLISFWEADSDEKPFKLISNEITGAVPPQDDAVKPAAESPSPSK